MNTLKRLLATTLVFIMIGGMLPADVIYAATEDQYADAVAEASVTEDQYVDAVAETYVNEDVTAADTDIIYAENDINTGIAGSDPEKNAGISSDAAINDSDAVTEEIISEDEENDAALKDYASPYEMIAENGEESDSVEPLGELEGTFVGWKALEEGVNYENDTPPATVVYGGNYWNVIGYSGKGVASENGTATLLMDPELWNWYSFAPSINNYAWGTLPEACGYLFNSFRSAEKMQLKGVLLK